MTSTQINCDVWEQYQTTEMNQIVWPPYTMNSVTPYLCGASEGQLVDIHVTGDSPSCSGAIPWDDVNYTGRKSSLQ